MPNKTRHLLERHDAERQAAAWRANLPPIEMPPVLRPKMACAYLGIHKTKLYKLIKQKKLITTKDGRITYITLASCNAHLLSLPAQRTREIGQSTRGKKR